MLPPLPSTDSPCRCGVLHSDQATTLRRYDRWLKPRPNTQWQEVENQRFVDVPRFDDESLETDEHESSQEDEASDGGGGDEAEEEPNTSYSHSNRLEVTNEVVSGIDARPDGQPPLSRCQQAPNQETPDEVLDPTEQEDGVITRFLEVMEDQDLHRDSTARLRSFFKIATVECLDQCSRSCKGSRILLEDRNFHAKTFRPYPRSLTPKKLYDALGRKVSRDFNY